MKREDEIYMASENTEMPFTTEVAQQVLRKAWRQGAQWADEHQSTTWIDINSNFPKINQEQKVSEWLFLRLSNGETVIGHMSQDKHFYQSHSGATLYNVTHWMNIPEI